MENKKSNNVIECLGKIKIDINDDVHLDYEFESGVTYICKSCMRELMNLYLQEMNKRDLKKGKTKLKRWEGK